MKKILLFITLISFTITQAQIVNIPDTNFKNKLLSANTTNDIAKDSNGNPMVIDTNNDNEIQESEAQNVYELDVFNSNISDLIGVEAFVNLTLLFCAYNQLSNLNVSTNTSLTRLWCYENLLSNLDVSANTSLTLLDCRHNQLNNLDVSENILLVKLYCQNNQLSNLDVSVNSSLLWLQCNVNYLSSLDVSSATSLTLLFCYSNQLGNLDVSVNNSLNLLKCGNNPNLSYINLKNGNNENVLLESWQSDLENLPNLQSVCVDALDTDLTAFILAETGHNVNFSTECSALALNQNTFLNFTVYPTPTENILNIKSKTEIINVEIYSKLGQKIKETTENKMDISNLMQGLYFVKAEDVNGNFGMKKIVKK